MAALIAGAGKMYLVAPSGEAKVLGALGVAEARASFAAHPVLVCHRPSLEARLGGDVLEGALDLLELFAFTRPARFCVPTPNGLAAALSLPGPGGDVSAQGMSLQRAGTTLLAQLASPDYRDGAETRMAARRLRALGWAWGDLVCAALGDTGDDGDGKAGEADVFAVWHRLAEWEDEAPTPPPGDAPLEAAAIHTRLSALLGEGAEERPSQRDYTSFVASAFAARETKGQPNAVLAEAGTGVGKTLGYIAPASLWAEQNEDSVWLSTYTKNLQRQIDQELTRAYPDPVEKARKVVIRKGRENYLCLLNFEEALGRAHLDPRRGITLGLIARWARYSRDGDMVGGDLPAWLMTGSAAGSGLTDRRGECIYSACAHFRKCFIESTARKARQADLVIANHALVMVRAAQYGNEEEIARRYVFDEAHHLFDAADSAFSAHLTGLEAAELRRWIRGAESTGRRRARGLETRVGDLLGEHPATAELMHRTLRAAAVLPGDGWMNRINGGQSPQSAQGPAEAFLAAVRAHVYARAGDENETYSLEASSSEPPDDLRQAAADLVEALGDIVTPARALALAIDRRLADEAEDLDSTSRNRLEAARLGLMRRLQSSLIPWHVMLDELESEADEKFIDWFSVDRAGGREIDVGFHRHWVDPTQPFSEAVLERAHSVVVTSATLRDQAMLESEDENSWSRAELRTGLGHLVLPPPRAAFPSPFDYAGQTRVFVVGDINRHNADHIAGAYRALFEAAGGGALGLFTAIRRLRAVYERIAEPMANSGLPLYAQHVDAFDAGTLIDIFRAEMDSCLLGTDAVRDGIDVPGEALRLIVFDRVPWPRPTILHRARRKAFGDREYDDMLTRLRLKQAYGRLIRRQDDRGVFVILDSATPTRLLSAFPQGVQVSRAGIAEVIAATKDFLSAASDNKLLGENQLNGETSALI